MSEGKPLNGGFSIVMHVVQLAAIVAGGVWILSQLQSKVDVIDQKVTSIQGQVDHIESYLGIWQPRGVR